MIMDPPKIVEPMHGLSFLFATHFFSAGMYCRCPPVLHVVSLQEKDGRIGRIEETSGEFGKRERVREAKVTLSVCQYLSSPLVSKYQ